MKKFYAFLAAAVALTASAQVLLQGGFTLREDIKPADVTPTATQKLSTQVRDLLPIEPAEAFTQQSSQLPVANVAGAPALSIAIGSQAATPAVAAPSKAPARVAQDTDDSHWQSIGTGKYTDDCINNVLQNWSSYTWNVEIEENINTPGYYRVAAPYVNYPGGGSASASAADPYLYIHAENPDRVYMMDYNTGYNIGYGEHRIRDLASYYLDNGVTPDECEEIGVFGMLRGGNITFPASSLQMYIPKLGQWYTVNQDGGWTVKLPDAKDYSVAVKGQMCNDTNIMTYTITAGADIAAVKAQVVKGSAQFLDREYKVVALEGDAVNVGVNTLDLTAENGRYSLLIAALDEDGNYVNGCGTYFYSLSEDDPSAWRSLGRTVYCEDIVRGMASWAGVSEYEYYVEIQASNETPGLYRLVNPYGEGSIFPNRHPQDHNHYLYIHAENPDKVYISESVIGYDMGSGAVTVASICKVNSNYDKAAYYGKLVNSKVTFPAQSIVLSEQEEQHGGWFIANKNGEFKVEIPYDPEAEWEKVNNAVYTDDCFNNVFGGVVKENFTWEVECWKSNATPGLYRLANPYTTFPGIAARNTPADEYMYLHAEDPSRVYFEEFYTGVEAGYGSIRLSTKAWNSMEDNLTVGDIDDLGVYGTFEDGEVTFPVRAIVMALAKYNSGNWVEVNRNGKWSVRLAGASGPVEPEPDPEWADLGEATYYDDCLGNIFNGFNNLSWKVACQENINTPGYYRVANPYRTVPGFDAHEDGDDYLYIHAENPDMVYMCTLDTGFDVGYGSIIFRDKASVLITDGEMDPEDLVDFGVLGKLDKGNITFPVEQLQMLLPNYSETYWWPCNKNGKWMIALPGAVDYSLSVETPLCGDSENGVQMTIAAGADIADVMVINIQGYYDFSDENFEFTAENGTALEPGTYTLNPSSGKGRYCIFAAGLDAEGNLVAKAGTFFYILEDNPDEWESLGITDYTDDILNSKYNFGGNYTFDVEVEENVNTPGYYRIVNPYGIETPFKNYSDVHTHNHYIYLHAEDPSKVYMEISPVGVVADESNGGMMVASLANNFQGAKDTDFGKMVDRVITFPMNALLVSEQRVSDGGWFYGNRNAAFRLVVPKSNNHIIWEQELEESYPASTGLELAASTRSGHDVVYSLATGETDDEEYSEVTGEEEFPIATIEDNYLTFHRPGKVQITAACPENDTHKAAAPVVRTLLVREASGVENVSVAGAAQAPVYYNLQGVRVDRPASGSVVIRVKGDKVTKIIVK